MEEMPITREQLFRDLDLFAPAPLTSSQRDLLLRKCNSLVSQQMLQNICADDVPRLLLLTVRMAFRG